jgi:hypothetical protein
MSYSVHEPGSNLVHEVLVVGVVGGGGVFGVAAVISISIPLC